MDLFRDAPFGQIVRYLSGSKFFSYPDERAEFDYLSCYDGTYKFGQDNCCDHEKHKELALDNEAGEAEHTPSARAHSSSEDDVDREKAKELAVDNGPAEFGAAKPPAADGSSETSDVERGASLGLQRTQTLPYTNERLEVERSLEIERARSRRILPSTTADGMILTDWYRTDDPENPQNWSQKKKAFVAFQIDVYTFVVYCGSAIYVSSELGVMARFGVGDFKASLGLALYVLGYGFGPLLWSPMSELPAFGRNVSYVATFAIYIILCVPTALVNNLGGLLVLRFLLGFFGSPCLATGGASMQDMYSLLYLPYSVALWVSAAFAAPAVGPLLSGFSVVAKNWRWSTWELLWMSAPVFILWFFCLPETSASNILLRRAARLRSRLEVKNIRSQSEIDREGLTAGAIFLDAIIKPCEIMIKDPAVLFTNVYTALTYGIYYSFFEAFPLVYGPLYGFNLGETGI
ncbi:hypothetical protein LTR16_001358, partial [Cryomyces antarcticus]